MDQEVWRWKSDSGSTESDPESDLSVIPFIFFNPIDCDISRHIPVLMSSLICCDTIPSLSAPSSDIPHGKAFFPTPRTQMRCRWGLARAEHSRFHHRLRGSGGEVEESWLLPPCLRLSQRPTAAQHERSCPHETWCWSQSPAPELEGHCLPERPGEDWRNGSYRGCDSLVCLELGSWGTWKHGRVCRHHSRAGRKDWIQTFSSQLKQKRKVKQFQSRKLLKVLVRTRTCDILSLEFRNPNFDMIRWNTLVHRKETQNSKESLESHRPSYHISVLCLRNFNNLNVRSKY